MDIKDFNNLNKGDLIISRNNGGEYVGKVIEDANGHKMVEFKVQGTMYRYYLSQFTFSQITVAFDKVEGSNVLVFG